MATRLDQARAKLEHAAELLAAEYETLNPSPRRYAVGIARDTLDEAIRLTIEAAAEAIER